MKISGGIRILCPRFVRFRSFCGHRMRARSRKRILCPAGVHPGEILQEELKERHIKQKDFAAAIGMEAPHLSALIHGRRNITSAIASRLQEALGIPASVWINLQNRYNLDKARQTEGKNSRFVAGYLSLHQDEPSRVFAEPEASEHESRKTVTLSIHKKDLPLLTALAARLGWLLD